jgi:hypothetical protein
VLRAAAIGGGAYMVGKRRQQAQDQQAQDQEGQAQSPQPAAQQSASPAGAPPAGGISDAAIQRLEQLGKLHEQGVLTDEEFAEQKTALLGR